MHQEGIAWNGLSDDAGKDDDDGDICFDLLCRQPYQTIRCEFCFRDPHSGDITGSSQSHG